MNYRFPDGETVVLHGANQCRVLLEDSFSFFSFLDLDKINQKVVSEKDIHEALSFVLFSFTAARRPIPSRLSHERMGLGTTVKKPTFVLILVISACSPTSHVRS